MELPEQDRQAFIDAARRRTQPQQGGAAFGVYPSSGKRPEKLNVSRDVNMPAQAARGWVAGTLGLPGDIESLGRMALNFSFGPGGVNVDETPVLPTSEFYQEYLPGRDDRPAAKFASGLGALAGGAGSTKLAGAAVKGAKATGKALGPKAAEMAEGYLQKSGLAPTVVKPKGGNWLSGSVEGATKPLKGGMVAGQTPAERIPLHEELLRDPSLNADQLDRVRYQLEVTRGEDAINNWIDTKLNKYIRNEMATPEDPVRKLAERGVLHVAPEQVGINRYRAPDVRVEQGYPRQGYGQSETAKAWEAASDVAITSDPAGDIGKTWPTSILEENPWISKLDPSTKVYEPSKASIHGLGFDHLIDELRNATRADSDLPANLRWKPEDLKKVTMEQAVERVAKINEYRAAKKAEADELLSRNPATFQFKDYEVVPGTQEPNSKGLSWKQIQPPNLEMPEGIRRVQQSATQGGIDVPGVGFIAAKWDAKTGLDWAGAERDAKKLLGKKPLQEALDYEADVMGHCVRGYCNDVLSGNKQIYSLRDKKGEPHVTIETIPGRPWNQRSGIFYEYPELEKPWAEFSKEINTAARAKGVDRDPNYIIGFPDWLAKNQPEVFAKYQTIFQEPPPEIKQIKGKGNAAPKKEYIPFVQDFVRSGNWSSVGDFHNTHLVQIDAGSEMANKLEALGKPVPKYVTHKELDELLKEVRKPGEFPSYAKGGLVQDTDAIAAKLTGMDKDKALTHALRMANAKQEAHMAAGGLAKVLKGAKAAPAAKPAQIGNYQALPLQLPRAPNLPPQELTKTAERVARQQMGEHVRKVPNKSENLAGRSMKEVERLKNLDIELQPTKDIPTPTVVPEKKGEVRIGLPGDISIADQILMSVDNLPIGAQQEGGALYGFGKMDLPDPAFWASNRVPAQQVQNKATDVANVFDTPDVLAMHLAMGHEAMNFAQHFADANLRAIQQMPVHPESAKLFNEIVRAGNPKTGEKFPHFPGVENYEETYKALQQDPEMRKWFNNRMKVDKITGPLGLPSGKEIEYAVMEPALSNMEPSMVGLSVGRLRPGAELIPGSAHKTYSHDIPGLALGRTQELLPVDLAFPDAAAHIRKTKKPDDFTATIQKLYPHQVVDQQYIDQVGEYYNRLRQIRGYKKGGTVKKSGLSVLNKAII